METPRLHCDNNVEEMFTFYRSYDGCSRHCSSLNLRLLVGLTVSPIDQSVPVNWDFVE